MTLMRVFCLSLIGFVLVGCSADSDPIPAIPPQDRNVGQSIHDTVSAQEESVNKIESSAKANDQLLESAKAHAVEVNRNATMIGEKTEDPTIKASADSVTQHATELESRLDATSKNNTSIAEAAAAIKQGNERLKTDSGSVLDLQKRNAELENEKEKLQNEAIEELYTTSAYIFGLGFFTILGGLFLAFFVNRKLGYVVAGVGLLGMAIAAGAIYYLKTIATVAVISIVVSIVVSVGVGIWYFVKEVREKDDYKTATEENVELIQKLKQEVPEEIRIKYFGEKVVEPVAVQLQSESTQQIVQKVKTQLNEGNE
jgi:hypothetical protein